MTWCVTARCSSLSFDLPRAHRDLPSFPTRRSSDLGARSTLLLATASTLLGVGLGVVVGMVGAFYRGFVDELLMRIMDALRSEEHTSELQSRLHLVCRLLLEKKKHHKRLAHLATHGQ